MTFISQGVAFTSLPTALRGKLQPNQLAVLWVIQSYAGANADCWPSLQTIADGAGMSKRCAITTVGQLESLGHLQRERRYKDRGDQSTNVYRVTVNHLANVPDPHADSAPPRCISFTTPVQDLHYPGAESAPELDTRELNTRELKTAIKGSKGKKRGRLAYTPEFEAFWNQYKKTPKRAGSGAKLEAFNQYKKLTRDVQEALEGALKAAIRERARNEQASGFGAHFPHCSKWLKNGYYEDFLQSATAAPAKPSPLAHPGAVEGDPF